MKICVNLHVIRIIEKLLSILSTVGQKKDMSISNSGKMRKEHIFWDLRTN
jgi:hypothetical protein